MAEVEQLYESFRRIPTYVLVIMIFTILQFLVVSCIAAFGAFQLHRIAEAAAASQPKATATWGQGQIPPGYGPPAQYGPRQP